MLHIQNEYYVPMAQVPSGLYSEDAENRKSRESCVPNDQVCQIQQKSPPLYSRPYWCKAYLAYCGLDASALLHVSPVGCRVESDTPLSGMDRRRTGQKVGHPGVHVAAERSTRPFTQAWSGMCKKVIRDTTGTAHLKASPSQPTIYGGVKGFREPCSRP